MEQNLVDVTIGLPPPVQIIKFGYALDFVVELDAKTLQHVFRVVYRSIEQYFKKGDVQTND